MSLATKWSSDWPGNLVANSFGERGGFRRRTVRGTVADFDEHAGFGTVRAEDGRELFFHCTQLADGSRTVDIGVPVRFEIVPGRLGRWEAARVEKQ